MLLRQDLVEGFLQKHILLGTPSLVRVRTPNVADGTLSECNIVVHLPSHRIPLTGHSQNESVRLGTLAWPHGVAVHYLADLAAVAATGLAAAPAASAGTLFDGTVVVVVVPQHVVNEFRRVRQREPSVAVAIVRVTRSVAARVSLTRSEVAAHVPVMLDPAAAVAPLGSPLERVGGDYPLVRHKPVGQARPVAGWEGGGQAAVRRFAATRVAVGGDDEVGRRGGVVAHSGRGSAVTQGPSRGAHRRPTARPLEGRRGRWRLQVEVEIDVSHQRETVVFLAQVRSGLVVISHPQKTAIQLVSERAIHSGRLLVTVGHRLVKRQLRPEVVSVQYLQMEVPRERVPQCLPTSLALAHRLPKGLEPVVQSRLRAEEKSSFAGKRDGDGGATFFLHSFDGIHFGQTHLEDEASHLGAGDAFRRPLEADEVISRENEISLFPAAEETISLLPQKTLLHR